LSEKAKWAAIYLLLGGVPLFFKFLPMGSEILSQTGIIDFLRYAPYAGLFLIAILGWKINQTRIFWSTFLLLFFYHYLLHPEMFHLTEPMRIQTFQIVSASYPLSLCVIYLLKESRIWSDWSLTRVLLASLPFVLLLCLFGWANDLYQKLLFWGPPSLGQLSRIPNLCWVTTGLFLLVVTYLPEPKIKPYMIALMTTFLPFLFCIQTSLLSNAPDSKASVIPNIVIVFVTITVILLFALLRMYVQKVYLDPLTAIFNRQALDERLHNLSGDFALAMVDIDHFKKFNDTYGHGEGDNVLRMVAQHLQEHLGDNVYRYGGEEFCGIFEGSIIDSAVEKMDKIRSTLEKRKFVLRGKRAGGYSGINNPFKKNDSRGKKVHITISAGVAFSSKKARTYEEVIKRADHFLYEAKEKGRNRVISGEK